VQRPAPTPAQVDAGIAKLRTCVQARCDVLQSAAAAGAAGGEQPASAGAEDQDVSFKWDRECEEALHTVVLNRIAVGTGCVLTRIAHARCNCCVCADRSRNRSQQAQVCFQGCAGTGDLAGRLGRREGAQARPHARDEAARARGRRQRRRQAAGGGGALTRHLAPQLRLLGQRVALAFCCVVARTHRP